MNIEAQYSLGRFRSRHYDTNLAKLFLFEGRRVRGDSAEILLTQGAGSGCRRVAVVMVLCNNGRRHKTAPRNRDPRGGIGSASRPAI